MGMDWEDNKRASREGYGYDRDHDNWHRHSRQFRSSRSGEERRPTGGYEDEGRRYGMSEYEDYRDSDYVPDSGRYQRRYAASHRPSRDNYQSDHYGGSRYGAAGHPMRHRGWPYKGERISGASGWGSRDYGGYDYGSDDDRGLLDRAGDEVASWFGDEEAERRRASDQGHRGRGPKNYKRSDDRIRDDVSDRITDDPHIDGSELEISVSDGEVTLDGTVEERFTKRRAEDIVESVSGVSHVQNNLRTRDRQPQMSRTDMKTGAAHTETRTASSRT